MAMPLLHSLFMGEDSSAAKAGALLIAEALYLFRLDHKKK